VDKPIEALAFETKEDAASIVLRHKKHASFKLYDVLAPCLEMCERCDASTDERETLNAFLAESIMVEGKKRYVERKSDIYTRVCRYVFSTSNYTNICRYAHCLREAVKLDIKSPDIAKYMRENGGVNGLYFRRPINLAIVRTSTFRLTKPVEIYRDREFTLTLRWTKENRFEVIEQLVAERIAA
jgi:hypothetical protein